MTRAIIILILQIIPSCGTGVGSPWSLAPVVEQHRPPQP